jgi:translation elongation factor P/translation initiation factor 5A
MMINIDAVKIGDVLDVNGGPAEVVSITTNDNGNVIAVEIIGPAPEPVEPM